MKKFLVFVSFVALALSASATGIQLGDTTYNEGGKAIAGAAAGAVAGAASQAAADANAKAAQEQTATGGKSDQSQKAISGGNVISVAGDSVERSAPSVFVSGGTPLPTGCRYVFGIGGSNANGSVSTAGIPLWKDSECKGAAAIGGMQRAPAGTYTAEDFRVVSCENFDAMENTPTCRDLRSRQAAEARSRQNTVSQ